MNDTTIAALKNRGLQLLQKQAFNEARDLYLEITRRAPGDSEAWFMLGAISGQMGNLDMAVSCGEKATAIKPDYADAWFNLGQAHLKKDEITDAILCLQRTIALQPGNVQAHLALGTAYLNNGEIDLATIHINTVVSLQPGNSHAWTLLASVYEKSGQTIEALECFQKADAISPDTHEINYNLGLLYNKLGNLEAAEKHMEKAVRIAPDEANYHNQHGLILNRLGKKEAAICAFRRALELDPGLEGVRFMLAALGDEPTPEQAPEKYVRGLFNEFADYFDKLLTKELEYKTPQLLNDALRKTHTDSCKQLNILDLGCGTGLCGPLLRDIANRMTGVDLSEKMLGKAGEKAVYDELIAGDVTRVLQTLPGSFDLIVAADVFPYIGDLDNLFCLVKTHLVSGGLFGFSTEALTDKNESSGYVLRAKRRYAHTEQYLRNLARANNMKVETFDQVDLRKDGVQVIVGYIVTLSKLPD